ncbi:uncharacterized protein EV422DRAFT_571006 [Fimicolochytrium jonesii]|uniref:uncharacterized protein n=1 Tax=Fimicolochytrium jonesii TaxID=1396493 RepID=UPI0022FEB87C|nr:uncharacterized protein EV422DRAFT_571006 [Fimicolochytrium jonesii]KAI8817166.1 hypothetical protein EV422DRAFT_571006 [Fimicolochytrium jonesii]
MPAAQPPTGVTTGANAVCDSQPLKQCLDRNNGDRSKCLKEWEDFKRECMTKKMPPAASATRRGVIIPNPVEIVKSGRTLSMAQCGR